MSAEVAAVWAMWVTARYMEPVDIVCSQAVVR